MLQRYLDLHIIINNILLKIPGSPNTLSADENLIFKDIVPILNIFKNITIDASAEKVVTISKIIPYIDFLLTKVEEVEVVTNTGIEMKSFIINEMRRRFLNIEQNYVVSVATVIDPRYKKIHFKNPIYCAKAIERIKRLLPRSIEVLQNQNTGESGVNEENPLMKFTSMKAKANKGYCIEDTSEMSAYLLSPTCSPSIDPLNFWNANKNNYPKLHEIAKRFLCIPATSTPSERLFSLAGNIIDCKRNRLSSEHLNMLIF